MKASDVFYRLDRDFYGGFDPEQLEELVIEFAKYHVTEALLSASIEADIKTEEIYVGSMGDNNGSLYSYYDIVDPDTILNVYPLENIE